MKPGWEGDSARYMGDRAQSSVGIPPHPEPHTAAVNILSTFPDFRFIIIPLLMSTSDEFHRE